MFRGLRFVPLLLLLAGAVLIVDAVVRGAAHASLVLIVPVLTGSSGEFLLGVLLVFLGLLSVPFLLLSIGGWEELPPSAGTPSSEHSGAGGVILIGPVPIFFGEWAGLRRRAYLWWVAVASLLFAVLLVAWVWLELRG